MADKEPGQCSIALCTKQAKWRCKKQQWYDVCNEHLAKMIGEDEIVEIVPLPLRVKRKT